MTRITTNEALIAIIAAAHGEMNIDRIIETIEAARAELIRRRPGTEGLGRDRAFGYLIREMEAARYEQIDFGNILDAVTDLDPEGYEDLTAGEDPEPPRHSLAWAIQELTWPALDAADAMA